MAGRPYHIDPEIGHGIDELAVSYGFVLITEDAISPHMTKGKRNILNQWTYHSRLYAAATAAFTSFAGMPNSSPKYFTARFAKSFGLWRPK